MKMLMFCDGIVRQQSSVREIATRYYYREGYRLEAGATREDLKIVHYQAVYADAGLLLIGDEAPEILQRSYRLVYEDTKENVLLRPDGAGWNRDAIVRLKETDLFEKFQKSVKRLVNNYGEKKRLEDLLAQLRAAGPSSFGESDGNAAIKNDEDSFLLDDEAPDEDDVALPATDTLESVEEQLAGIEDSLSKTLRVVNKRFDEVSIFVRFNSLAKLLAGAKGRVPLLDDNGLPLIPVEEDDAVEEDEDVEFIISPPQPFRENVEEFLGKYLSDIIVAEL